MNFDPDDEFPNSKHNFEGTADASFADGVDRRSAEDYTFKLFGGLIDWASRKKTNGLHLHHRSGTPMYHYSMPASKSSDGPTSFRNYGSTQNMISPSTMITYKPSGFSMLN